MSEGIVTAVVEDATVVAEKELKLRQIVDLQAEIASEEASVALMESRKQGVIERIAGLKSKLAELTA